MSNNTADGLRSRLFDALDRVIAKEISQKEVESVCFVSEQIIKTARVELEIIQETNKNTENARQHQLKMTREQASSVKLLGDVLEAHVEDIQDEI